MVLAWLWFSPAVTGNKVFSSRVVEPIALLLQAQLLGACCSWHRLLRVIAKTLAALTASEQRSCSSNRRNAFHLVIARIWACDLNANQ